MLSGDQIRRIVEAHLDQTVKTGLIHGGDTELSIFNIDPPRSMTWKGNPAWEIELIYSTNVTITDRMTSSSREYRYRKTLVIDESGIILHVTKPKIEKHVQGPDFHIDL